VFFFLLRGEYTGSRPFSLSLSNSKTQTPPPPPPHLGLEGLSFALSSPGGDALLLKQGEEFRVREWRAVVGQPVEFFVLFRGVRGGV
jgi:hypothetical protein